MGAVTFRVTFEDDRKESFHTLQRAIFAVKEGANKLKLIGEERQLCTGETMACLGSPWFTKPLLYH